MTHKILRVFTDGGVIRKNPSPYGGTWAYRHLGERDQVLVEEAQFVTPSQLRVERVTNNQTELIALVKCLLALPYKWSGQVNSDSGVTLGRVFDGFDTNNIPPGLLNLLKATKNHIDLKNCEVVLLSGHPTKAQLSAGVGRNGRPVSEHNVWCDKACKEKANLFMEMYNNGENTKVLA